MAKTYAKGSAPRKTKPTPKGEIIQTAGLPAAIRDDMQMKKLKKIKTLRNKWLDQS